MTAAAVRRTAGQTSQMCSAAGVGVAWGEAVWVTRVARCEPLVCCCHAAGGHAWSLLLAGLRGYWSPAPGSIT